MCHTHVSIQKRDIEVIRHHVSICKLHRQCSQSVYHNKQKEMQLTFPHSPWEMVKSIAVIHFQSQTHFRSWIIQRSRPQTRCVEKCREQCGLIFGCDYIGPALNYCHSTLSGKNSLQPQSIYFIYYPNRQLFVFHAFVRAQSQHYWLKQIRLHLRLFFYLLLPFFLCFPT